MVTLKQRDINAMQTPKIGIEHFWSKVGIASIPDPVYQTYCWVWLGSRRPSTVASRIYGDYCGELAHRVAAAIYAGTRIGTVNKGCNNPLCVRRDHFASVGWEKQRDRYDRITGRPVLEATDPNHPMFREIVQKRYYRQAVDKRALARYYHLTLHQVMSVYRRTTIDVILLELNMRKNSELTIQTAPNPNALRV